MKKNKITTPYTNRYAEYKFGTLKDCIQFLLEAQLVLDDESLSDESKSELYYDLGQLIHSDCVVEGGFTNRKNDFKRILNENKVEVVICQCDRKYEIEISGVNWEEFGELSMKREESVFVNKAMNNYMYSLIDSDNRKKYKNFYNSSVGSTFQNGGIRVYEIKMTN